MNALNGANKIKSLRTPSFIRATAPCACNMTVFFSANIIVYSFLSSSGASWTSWREGRERWCWPHGMRHICFLCSLLLMVWFIWTTLHFFFCRAHLVPLVPEVLRVLVELMYVSLINNNVYTHNYMAFIYKKGFETLCHPSNYILSGFLFECDEWWLISFFISCCRVLKAHQEEWAPWDLWVRR